MFYTPSNEEFNEVEKLAMSLSNQNWHFIKQHWKPKYVVKFALLPDEVTNNTFKALSQSTISQKEAMHINPKLRISMAHEKAIKS